MTLDTEAEALRANGLHCLSLCGESEVRLRSVGSYLFAGIVYEKTLRPRHASSVKLLTVETFQAPVQLLFNLYRR